MSKRIIGLLAVSALLMYGCGDSPTQPRFATPGPTPRPTPTAAPPLAPVVVSVEPNTDRAAHYFGDWIFRGSGMVPDPVATFESSGVVIPLFLEENTFAGNYVVVSVPAGTAPGSYTPCVATIYGKGCGAFLVSQK